MSNKNPYSKANQRVVIAMGDPAGIGIEVTLKALGSLDYPAVMQPILVGCRRNIELVYKQLKSKGIKLLANPANLQIEDIPIEENINPGKPNAKTGDASFRWLNKATDLLLNKQARALVTAPIAKYAWHEAGHIYPGQTELLAKLSGISKASMMFTARSPKNGWRLNTLLATTHTPLTKVSQELTPKLIKNKLDILLSFCKRFNKNPVLAVAGLNPHAGEQGNLGKEEIDWLIPTLKEWQLEHPSIKLEGPIPPDTCWINSAKAFSGLPNGSTPNGILALYHDQGLIPVKLIAFEYAVNTTLGLPFIRTSPDHGTGFDIAGQGCASSTSMLAALQTAWELTK